VICRVDDFAITAPSVRVQTNDTAINMYVRRTDGIHKYSFNLLQGRQTERTACESVGISGRLICKHVQLTAKCGAGDMICNKMTTEKSIPYMREVQIYIADHKSSN
jgi:hypothetical protein